MASLAIDTLWYSDKGQAVIGKTDTQGQVSFVFDSYDTSIRDLAWDGTNVWAINLNGTVKKFSPSGSLLHTYSGLLSDGWGLTFDGMYIWASDPKADQIYRISFPGQGDFSPPPAPALASPTHPSQQTWYHDDSPAFQWTEPADPSDIDGYSFWLDHTSTTQPDTTSEGVTTSTNYVGLAEGTWYFHCRARDGSGNWGATGHYRVKVDKTAPAAPLNVTVVPGGWSKTDLFAVTWTNPPDSSTIAGILYKNETPPLHNDDGTFTQASELHFSLLIEGEQNLYLWLRDGAGNRNYAARSVAILRYDGSGPYEGTISINDGSAYTLSPIVALGDLGALDYLSGFGPGSLMRFSNNGIGWSPAEPYAGDRPNWDLTLYGGTDDPGLKIVFVQYQDEAGNWSLSFSDSIIWAGPLSIATDILPGGTVEFAYRETLAVDGGIPPYAWRVMSGALPRNMFLDAGGIIQGVPDLPGTFTFQVEVADSTLTTDTKNFSIMIFAGNKRGDVDGDSELDLFDALLTIRYILGQADLTYSQLWAADALPDGLINISDVIAIVNLILGRSPGAARTAAPAGVVISLVESLSLEGSSGQWTLLLENPAPVSGLQIKLILPHGSRLSSQPRLSEAWPGHSLTFSETEGRVHAIIYSVTGDVFPSSSGPIFSFGLAPEKHLGGDRDVMIGELLAAGEDGSLLPVEIEALHVQTDSLSTAPAWNYPNPFNASTDIRYEIPDSRYQMSDGRYLAHTTLKIYNILGREMQTLVNAYQEPGLHTVSWDGRDEQGQSVPSGVYFCRIEGQHVAQTLKLVLMR